MPVSTEPSDQPQTDPLNRDQVNEVRDFPNSKTDIPGSHPVHRKHFRAMVGKIQQFVSWAEHFEMKQSWSTEGSEHIGGNLPISPQERWPMQELQKYNLGRD